MVEKKNKLPNGISPSDYVLVRQGATHHLVRGSEVNSKHVIICWHKEKVRGWQRNKHQSN